jgi:hypothetical protein
MMNRLLQADASELKTFIVERVSDHPGFKSGLLDVSVDRYPDEFFATIWLRHEPGADLRDYAYSLENELRNLGVACSITVKTDRELSLGGVRNLRTNVGSFSFRFYRVDRVKDEDIVYVYVLYRDKETFRFRLSLSGTLAAMLRGRNRLHIDRIEEIYLDWIKAEVEKDQLADGDLRDFMFTSTDLSKFIGTE